jgi:hypothetical protein
MFTMVKLNTTFFLKMNVNKDICVSIFSRLFDSAIFVFLKVELIIARLNLGYLLKFF